MFKCLAINAHEKDILNRMFRFDQAQELLELGDFLLGHLEVFFVFVNFAAVDQAYSNFLARNSYCVV